MVEQQVQQVLKAFLVLQEQLVHKELLDLKVQLEFKVQLVQEVEIKVHLVLLELQVHKALRV